MYGNIAVVVLTMYKLTWSHDLSLRVRANEWLAGLTTYVKNEVSHHWQAAEMCPFHCVTVMI